MKGPLQLFQDRFWTDGLKVTEGFRAYMYTSDFFSSVSVCGSKSVENLGSKGGGELVVRSW